MLYGIFLLLMNGVVFYFVFVCVFGEKGVEATMDGVLGGYGHVNDVDIKASEAFLNTLLAERFPDAGRGRHLVALGTYAHLFTCLY